MNKKWSPQAGDIVKLSFDPTAGHEQAGWRPAIVVSEASYNRRAGLALVCPITNQARGYPFEIVLPEDLTVQGVILADHIKSVDFKARRSKHVETVPDPVLETVRGYIALLIGFK